MKKIKSKYQVNFFSKDEISVFDWLIFLAIGMLCICICLHGDIMHTIGASFTYLNGHILDFYDYNQTVPTIGGLAYLPSTYILFAIWNIPIRLLGIVKEAVNIVPLFVVVWNKILTTLFYLGAGGVIYKICESSGMSKYYSKLCAFVFLTAPMGFFSQFIFGQYDVFTIFFVLLGYYYYLNDNTFKFILFFGIAITFKYFSLLIFVPLLLFKEKDILKIILKGIAVGVPFFLEVLFYFQSEAFRNGVFGFGAKNYIFETGFTTTYFSLSVFIVGWMLINGWAYFENIENKENKKNIFSWSIFFISLVLFLFFGMSMWHPQWLLFAMPFWSMGSMISKRKEAFLVLDIIMMLLFVIFVVNIWANGVDQYLLKDGLLGSYINKEFEMGMMMRDIFIINDTNLVYSFLSGLMAINAIFKHPKYSVKDWSNLSVSTNLIRIRFIIGVMIFLVPLVICFYSIL